MRPLIVLSTLVSLSAFAAPEIGKPAPAFKLMDESGKVHTLESYKGKTVVLEWTNPGCPFVQDHYERKTMKTVSEKFGGKDVVWIAVDSTHSVTVDSTKEWKKKWPVSFPTLLDADGTVGKAYEATNTPHMFVIDKSGNLAYRGAIDSDASKSDPKAVNYVDLALTAVLAGKSADPASTKAYGCSVKYK